MEAAECPYHLFSGSEVEVISVAQDDLGPGAAHFVRVEPPDRSVGSDRHEGGGFDRAMRKDEVPGAGKSFGGVDSELEHCGEGNGLLPLRGGERPAMQEVPMPQPGEKAKGGGRICFHIMKLSGPAILIVAGERRRDNDPRGVGARGTLRVRKDARFRHRITIASP